MAMKPFQTTYNAEMAPAFVGMVANSEKSNIVSRVAEDADGIAFGVPALRGANDNGITNSAGGGAFLGITVADTTQLQDSYLQYGTVAVITMGVIWVTAAVAVAAGDPVYFVPADGTFTNVDGGGANTEIPNSSWDSSTTDAAALAKVRLR